MGKFRAGLQASQEVEPENQKTIFMENHNSIEPENQETIIPSNQYSVEDMELVNVGGFKVPRVVREHWTVEAKRARTPISRLFRDLLVEKFGLPEGITTEDL